jgi:hypothetical protein
MVSTDDLKSSRISHAPGKRLELQPARLRRQRLQRRDDAVQRLPLGAGYRDSGEERVGHDPAEQAEPHLPLRAGHVQPQACAVRPVDLDIGGADLGGRVEPVGDHPGAGRHRHGHHPRVVPVEHGGAVRAQALHHPALLGLGPVEAA